MQKAQNAQIVETATAWLMSHLFSKKLISADMHKRSQFKTALEEYISEKLKKEHDITLQIDGGVANPHFARVLKGTNLEAPDLKDFTLWVKTTGFQPLRCIAGDKEQASTTLELITKNKEIAA